MELPAGKSSIEELVELYYQPLYCYAFRLTGTATDAEDLTQESFCQGPALPRSAAGPGQRPRRGYSASCVTYICIAFDRSEITASEFMSTPTPCPMKRAAPLEHVDAEALQRVLDELPEVFRTPLILYYFEDFSYRDIAEQMELPIGTVMSRLARAKAHLRILLGSNRALSPLTEADSWIVKQPVCYLPFLNPRAEPLPGRTGESLEAHAGQCATCSHFVAEHRSRRPGDRPGHEGCRNARRTARPLAGPAPPRA